MKVIHFDTAETYEPEPDWKRVSLCGEPEISIEYFVKPPHHASPLHEHPQSQVTVVTRGRMRVRNAAGEEALLSEGDSAYFAGGEPHLIENDLDVPSIGIDIFTPARSFDFWTKRLKQP